jgi:hypothetical protein
MSVYSVEKNRSNFCEGKTFAAMSIQTSIMVERDKEAFGIEKLQKPKRILSVLTWCYNVTMPSPLACFVCFRQVCGGRPVEAQGTLVFVTWWDFWSPEDIKRNKKNLQQLYIGVFQTPPPQLPLRAPYAFGAGWPHSGNALAGGLLCCTYFEVFVPDFLRIFNEKLAH